ncbi:MAG: cupin domain-containing protein [Wenzhouxiangellaceae bacterium]
MNSAIRLLMPAVLAGLVTTVHPSTDHFPYRGEGHVIVNSDVLEWGPVASMPDGARMAVLEGDLGSEEPFTFRLKLPANFVVAPHTHPAYERVTVLEGTFHFAHGREFDRDRTLPLRVGGFAVMAPGEPMFGYTEETTIIQLHGTGPWGIEYINPEDDPRL